MQGFGQKLFEKRIECYPVLYSIVCRYARDLKENSINSALFKDYYKETSDWDVKSSIYMNAKTHYVFHQLRIELLDASKLPEIEITEKLKSIEFRKKLRETSNKVELVLKNELGIYAFESPNQVNPGIKFESYNEADLHVKNNK